MRIRATAAAAVISGAVALTAVVIPAAQAAGPTRHQAWQLAQKGALGHPAAAHSTALARSAAVSPAADPAPLAVTFANVKVNSGKAIVVGTTNAVRVPYTYTLTAVSTTAAPIDPTDSTNFVTGVGLYRGDNIVFGDNPATCKAAAPVTGPTGAVTTTESCTGRVDIYPKGSEDDGQSGLTTADAGAHWQAQAIAIDLAGQTPNEVQKQGFASPTLQRFSQLTVNASPEPVKKGGTVTIVGSLTRANWDTHKYAGYTVQPVKLQFRKATSTTYTTLKTVKTDSHGNLKTTYKASVAGYWRYSFAGTPTTPAISAIGDYVALKK